MKKGIAVMAMAFVAAVCVEIGCGCGVGNEVVAQEKPVEATADEGESLTCSLSKVEMKERRGLVREVIGGSLIGWKAVEGGTLLKLEPQGVEKAMRLVMLERRCCVGVGAVLTLKADDDNAELVLEGPEFFEEELAKMLEKAPRLGE